MNQIVTLLTLQLLCLILLLNRRVVSVAYLILNVRILFCYKTEFNLMQLLALLKLVQSENIAFYWVQLKIF